MKKETLLYTLNTHTISLIIDRSLFYTFLIQRIFHFLVSFLFLLHTCTQCATEVKMFVVFSLKLLRCRDRVLPPLDGHTYCWPFFLRITLMRIVASCAMDAPCRKLSFRSSFKMIILELVRVVQLALYRCARYISGTLFLL